MTHCIKRRFVGLDVHKDSIVIAVADAGRDAARLIGKIPHEWKALRNELDKLGPRSTVCCCYEAGPTGYGLARTLIAAGWACDVIAPSLVPKKSGQRIKTDRRDAVRLAQNHRAGELVAVFIPDEQTEAIRDLERARGAAKKSERTVRHQLSKFLLRHGKIYPDRATWNSTHMAWIAKQTFVQPAQQYVLADGLAAVESATLRVAHLTQQLRQLVEGWHQAPLVKALQAMRGVELVTAVTLAAEVGDFRRFATASDFMGYVGLIPSEHTSGEHRRQGPITKTGNSHLRHVLTESAWHYLRQPRISKALRLRSMVVAPQVCAIAWKAQKRLHQRLQRLIGRGKNPGEAVTAAARELAGFVWAIAREEKLLAS